MIRTSGLTKHYGRVVAVDGVDLEVQEGDVYGFLGPNGSGKTTTVRMLLGRPMPGSAGEVLPSVGALVEGPAAYAGLSGRANLALIDAMGAGGVRSSRAGRIDDALERVGLGGIDRRPVRAYSLGMRQRLGLASALMRAPRLLVLDEPTNGLDPQGIREIRDLLLELNVAGTTVFLSSHLLDEIEQVCTHAAVMARGRLITQGSVSDLAAGSRGRLVVTTPDTADAARVLKEQGVGDVVIAEDRVTSDPPEGELSAVNAALVTAGVRVRGFGVERASLEDAFVALTGEGFDVAG